MLFNRSQTAHGSPIALSGTGLTVDDGHGPLCGCSLGRRQALGLAAAAGAASLVPARLRAQPAAAGNPRRIDVHHHIIPPIYLERARDRLIASSDTSPEPLLSWTPERTLEDMDKYGVATALTSISTPGIWFGDNQAGRDLARACNEYGAKLATDHPGRFGLLAALPLPDQEGSLREIEYAFDTLKADGICLLTSYDGKWPGDVAFRPVFEELNRRKARVYFHPTAPSCCANLIPGMPPSTTEFLFDSTRALLSMMVSGTFTACPDLRCIFAHTGGATSVLATRIAAFFARHPELKDKLPDGAMATFRRQYYDIANSVNPTTLPAGLSFVGVSQLLFGSDNPFVPLSVTANAFDKFDMAAADKAAINRGTAATLFPRFA
jgi:predicted TIM-barrel fold metal-dependent hydrolase